MMISLFSCCVSLFCTFHISFVSQNDRYECQLIIWICFWTFFCIRSSSSSRGKKWNGAICLTKATITHDGSFKTSRDSEKKHKTTALFSSMLMAFVFFCCLMSFLSESQSVIWLVAHTHTHNSDALPHGFHSRAYFHWNDKTTHNRKEMYDFRVWHNGIWFCVARSKQLLRTAESYSKVVVFFCSLFSRFQLENNWACNCSMRAHVCEFGCYGSHQMHRNKTKFSHIVGNNGKCNMFSVSPSVAAVATAVVVVFITNDSRATMRWSRLKAVSSSSHCHFLARTHIAENARRLVVGICQIFVVRA